MRQPHLPLLARGALAIAATALALSLAPAASAQPMSHGGGDLLGPMPGAIKSKLNLDTSQQLQWDSVVADTRAAHDAARAAHQRVHDALKAQLATASPDLASVAAAADEAGAQARAQRKQVRDEWLALYATFGPEQKAVVRDALAQRLARADAMRERMKQHRKERLQPSGG